MSQPAVEIGLPRISRDDCELLGKYQISQSWNAVPSEDQESLKDLRKRLKQIATLLAERYPGRVKMKPFASHPSPNGRTSRDYWCCIFPVKAEHKSFGLQMGVIVSATGAELLFCVGSGEAQAQFETAERALQVMQAQLAETPPEIIHNVGGFIANTWDFRRHWREKPGQKDFDTFAEWIAHASSPTGKEASVSRNLSVDELDLAGGKLLDIMVEAAQTFAPLIEWSYGEEPISSRPPVYRRRYAPSST